MKKNNKLIIMLLGLFLVTGCGCSNKDNNINDNAENIVKVNSSEGVIKNQALDVFTFTNTSLVYEDNTSTLITTITNNSSEIQYLEEFKIHVYKDDYEVITLTGYVGSYIDPNSSTSIVSSYGEDITNATKITYEIKR